MPRGWTRGAFLWGLPSLIQLPAEPLGHDQPLRNGNDAVNGDHNANAAFVAGDCDGERWKSRGGGAREFAPHPKKIGGEVLFYMYFVVKLPDSPLKNRNLSRFLEAIFGIDITS